MDEELEERTESRRFDSAEIDVTNKDTSNDQRIDNEAAQDIQVLLNNLLQSLEASGCGSSLVSNSMLKEMDDSIG
jgi:hypothetical protein